jgi:hypothetical protein
MEQPVTTIKVVQDSPTPDVDHKRNIDDQNLQEVLSLLAATLESTDEDKEQVGFVVALQKNRKFLLEYAMKAYMERPSPSQLEVITSLLGHMEKAVRDDRKERMKKQENQDNAISFKQMLDAMSMIKQGAIALPVFDLSSFMLDPNKSVIADEVGVKPILAQELTMGNELVNIDGEVAK